SLVANRAGLQRNRARSALSESTGARGELDALLVLEGNAELAVDEIGDGERSSVRAQRRARYDELSAAVGKGAADELVSDVVLLIAPDTQRWRSGPREFAPLEFESTGFVAEDQGACSIHGIDAANHYSGGMCRRNVYIDGTCVEN